MPLYEYRCEKCGKTFEVRQKFADAPLETHEECGGKVERLISVPSLQFKGSGFYVNDYPHGSTPRPEHKSSDAKSESKSEAKPDSKPSESKPAETKTESKSSKD